MGGPNLYFLEEGEDFVDELREYETIGEPEYIGGLKCSRLKFKDDDRFHKNSPYVFHTSDVYIKPFTDGDSMSVEQLRFSGSEKLAILDIDFDGHYEKGVQIFPPGVPHVHELEVKLVFNKKRKQLWPALVRSKPRPLSKDIYEKYKEVIDHYTPSAKNFVK